MAQIRQLRRAGSGSTGLPAFLFAVALVRASDPFLLTAVLPGTPTVLAPLHKGDITWNVTHGKL